jgi:hypothetical protein
MDFTFGLDIGLKLEDYFLKLGGLYIFLSVEI